MRQYVKNQSSAIYNTGWTMAYVKSFTDEQLKQEFEKIRKVQSHSQIQAFSQTLKRLGPVLEEPSSKRPKSPKAPTSSMHAVPISPADFDAPAQTFLKLVVNEESKDEDSDDEVWSAVVGWEILHMVDRQDLMKLYGLVEIRSWRLYTLSNVHVLETVSGEVLSMFTDVSYPLSVELMKRMLMHKLQIDSDFVGNDLTTAE
nr:aminoacyl-tRNA synthetase, class 1a, anticodon-binding [Tanacetum cinerariifolium]